MRIIEVIADTGHRDTLRGIAEQFHAQDIWCGEVMEDERQAFRLLVHDKGRQELLDSLQNLLASSDNARIVVQPVDVVLPRPTEADKEDEARKAVTTTREELYNQVEKGSRLDSNFLLLVMLSTVVAAVGLIEDNVAVVVGAMVIAPLLGPNIALALATSLGDKPLLWQALRTNIVGLTLAAGLAFVIGLLWPLDLSSGEVMARTDVGLDGVALALASGAAAVLSLTTGLSSTLVGVMVAVALLPPTATFGMLLGSGQTTLATGAALLLAVNIVCVILSAKLVFLAKGVQPRTWLEKRKAQQSRWLYGLFWLMLLLALLVLIGVRGNHVI
ncbi:MAG: TIGR00341 family protein [Chromatiales bacterium]|jgi:uncharacterized hydrophobic protein (TIGR00341 family)